MRLFVHNRQDKTARTAASQRVEVQSRSHVLTPAQRLSTCPRTASPTTRCSWRVFFFQPNEPYLPRWLLEKTVVPAEVLTWQILADDCFYESRRNKYFHLSIASFCQMKKKKMKRTCDFSPSGLWRGETERKTGGEREKWDRKEECKGWQMGEGMLNTW